MSAPASPPVLNSISTNPNPPINGQAFTMTMYGSSSSSSSNTVYFSGPGRSSPCSVSASGSTTQISGQAILATGAFSVSSRREAPGIAWVFGKVEFQPGYMPFKARFSHFLLGCAPAAQ